MRNLLLLRAKGATWDWLTQLEKRGWVIYVSDEARHAVHLLETHPFRVGLVEVDPGDRQERWNWQARVMGRHPELLWIFLVERAGLGQEAIRNQICDYGYDYHTLPVDLERLTTTLGRAYGMARLRNTFGETSRDGVPTHYGIVGESPVLRAMLRKLAKAARADVPVMISGESGTGKELVARAVHRLSDRCTGPFVVVNCGALPPTLIQSELFGHEKGAFTGALARKVGRLELAAGGTLFLDEIGELSAALQVNLLRFLQEGTVERLGGRETLRVDVRVVAATNVDLEQAVEEGGFREDLYYRLNVVRLHLPALRERGRDIEHLARFFLKKLREETHQIGPQEFSPAALEAIRRYSWPGNVRELINKIRRAVILAEGPRIVPADLEFDVVDEASSAVTLDEARRAAERHAIQAALIRNGDNVTRAARELGVSRVTFYRLLEKHGLSGSARSRSSKPESV